MTGQEPRGANPSVATLVCSKCDFENQVDLKFCGNCGARLRKTPEGAKNRFEALGLLYFTGSIYLLLSLTLNQSVSSTILFSLPYLIVGLVGLYVGYSFYTGSRVDRTLSLLSIVVVVTGLAFTGLLFLIGLAAKGVIGPAWVIFAVTAFAIWKKHQHGDLEKKE